MSIVTTKTSTGFSVKLPFELKDNFKSVFKSAKWNANSKEWEVGSRSGKRLEQWVAIAEPAAKDIEDAESAALEQQELDAIATQIAQVRAEIARTKQQSLSASSSISLLEANAKLKQAQSEYEQEKINMQEKVQSAEDLLASTVDLGGIYSAVNTMQANHGKVGSKPREAFRESAAFIKEQREKLAAIGIASVGLDTIWAANFNRADRDRIEQSDIDKIIDLVEINEND